MFKSCLKGSLNYKEEHPETLYLLGVAYLWIGKYENAKAVKTVLSSKFLCVIKGIDEIS